ncbi:General substrate transporter [Carbonactinospora thermoautotrophica]|uniref:General substrate transporter n=1 Tax=Carbonactinospora thermoautotrophica TaxID=1469144 RepID=A0A132MUV0_9ACTN|nr:MFS transporter [Carbonactinospora thermoautotrophica]KWX01609.1 General substrate transporter [Carbonactinospora thermoautotrophica]
MSASTIPMRRVALSGTVGTAIEWYDYFLYGTAAAVVFNKVFFPTFSAAAGTLAALATFGVGFFARPVGAMVFGHFGDRVGRKAALLTTLTLMAGSSFLIGLLPGYQTIGVLAPLLLTILRFVQGFALGGEWGGGALIIVEHSPARRRGFYGSLLGCGVPAGLLLATAAFGAVSLLPDDDFLAWGWRLPFLASAVMLIVGTVIRFKVSEPAVFTEIKESQGTSRNPLFETLRHEWRHVLLAGLARFAPDIGFYVCSTFLITYVVNDLGLSRDVGLAAQLIGAGLMLLTIPYFGYLSDRIGRRPVYMISAIALAVLAPVQFLLLDTKVPALITVVPLIGLGISHAAAVAPQASFYAELFGTRTRYSGAALGYQLGAPFAGGLAPIIATWLISATGGETWPVSVYMLLAAAISFVALLRAPETRGLPLGAAAGNRQDARPTTVGVDDVTAPLIRSTGR